MWKVCETNNVEWYKKGKVNTDDRLFAKFLLEKFNWPSYQVLWGQKRQPTKETKQTTYLAFTVPIRLSSEERANAGSSTVTSNFGKTEQNYREFHWFLNIFFKT